MLRRRPRRRRSSNQIKLLEQQRKLLGDRPQVHHRSHRRADHEPQEASSTRPEKSAKDSSVAKQKEADRLRRYRSRSRRPRSFEDIWKQINAAWDTFDADKVKRGLQGILAEFEGLNNELEAQHNAQFINDQQFFKRRAELIQKSVGIEIAALQKANAALAQLPKDNFSVEGIDRQNKIADNEARIALLRKQSASQLRVVETQQQGDLHKTQLAYDDAQASADRYVETLSKRFEIESKGLGLGEEARKRLQDEADLQDRFQDRRQELERDRRRGDITEETYKRLLGIEEAALHKSEEAYAKHYDELKQKQGNWVVGAMEAFANFRDGAANVAQQVDEVFTRAFDGLADSLVQFATTGKLNFKQLVNSVIADLLRIEAKVALSKALKPIFEQIGNIFTSAPASGGGTGSGGFVGPRATGGPVTAGMTYLVNEDTPRSELFTPEVNGWITPRNGMGGGTTIHNTNYFSSGVSPAQIEASLDARDANILNQVLQGQRRGRAGA
jgi:lambda family phage tail tape measure protein